MPIDPSLAIEPYCYLTTTGRVTGRPHTIEIWFALHGNRLYMLAGGRNRADWVRNLRRQPRVSVRIATQTFEGTAGIVSNPEEDTLARRLLLAKYQHGDDLTEWGRTALPIAVDLEA
jgi:deazaflavin-dependent oxidoreductase (nitroreductase family)